MSLAWITTDEHVVRQARLVKVPVGVKRQPVGSIGDVHRRLATVAGGDPVELRVLRGTHLSSLETEAEEAS